MNEYDEYDEYDSSNFLTEFDVITARLKVKKDKIIATFHGKLPEEFNRTVKNTEFLRWRRWKRNWFIDCNIKKPYVFCCGNWHGAIQTKLSWLFNYLTEEVGCDLVDIWIDSELTDGYDDFSKDCYAYIDFYEDFVLNSLGNTVSEDNCDIIGVAGYTTITKEELNYGYDFDYLDSEIEKYNNS